MKVCMYVYMHISKIFKYLTRQVCKYATIFKNAYMEVFMYAKRQICRYDSRKNYERMLVCMYESTQVCKLSSVQVSKHTNMTVNKCASGCMQVCLFVSTQG